MKGDFIIKFLEVIKDIALELGTGWARIPYKGVRYSNFDIYGNDLRKKYTGFKNLEKRGLIKMNNDRFSFTKSGQKWLSLSLKRYFIKQSNGKWDKKWRIVIFDIPEELHSARVRFRRKLKSLGFVMLQKSVFVFPYPCHEEIGDICNKLEVSDCVDIIVAESAGFKEKELLKIFNLEY